MKKRIISLILCFALLVCLAPSAFAVNVKDFSDLPAVNHWSYQALCAAVDNGLLQGSKGLLNPNNPLTRAQMAAIINRAFGAIDLADISEFTDVPAGKWYRNDIARAYRMGTLNGYGKGLMQPDAPITREQAFTVIARALKLENGDTAVLDRFSDKAQLANYAKAPVAAMVQGGYVNGSGGKLNPKNSIKRAEFAQVFYNVLKMYYKTAGEYSTSIDGNAIVNTPGVCLKDMQINGDLIIGEGVANGEVTLDHVEVSGRMVVRGGGAHSVILKNSSMVGSVLVGKTGDGGLRIRTEEGCRIEVIKIDDGRDEIILEGEFNQIAIATDAPVILADADVTGLTITAKNADVSLRGETAVSSVKLSSQAEGAKLAIEENAEVSALISRAENAFLQGTGTLRTAEVSGSNTVIDTKGTILTVAEGTRGVKENGNEVKAGQTVETGADSGDDPPLPHIHDFGEGTVTTAATCENPGVRTYRCACGQTRTEEIAALGHDWDDGAVTKEPGLDGDGEMTFRCKRCGVIKTEPISRMPFCITLNQGEENQEELYFETLEEALAEAKKHPHENEPDEDPWTEYETITLCGSAVIDNLSLPAGYSLFVCGSLTLNGTVTLGSSDYALCPGKGAARIMVPMFDETSLTINDVNFYNASQENCVITCFADEANADAEHMDVVTLYGTREADKAEDPGDESVCQKPWISFGGFFGQQCFRIVRDCDFTRYFDGVLVDDSVSCLQISADVNLNRTEIWGDGKIVLADEGEASGSISMDGRKLFGFTDSCTVQMTGKGGGTPCEIVGNREGILLLGGDIKINQNAQLHDLHVRPCSSGASNPCTLTVPAGVRADLQDCQFAESVHLMNNGTLNIGGYASVDGELINNGTVDISGAFDCGKLENNGSLCLGAGRDEERGEYWNGSLNISGEELQNNGLLRIDCYDGEAYRCGALYANDGAVVTNLAGANIQNYGRLNLSNSKLVNYGTVLNNAELEIAVCDEIWVSYGEGEPAQQESGCGRGELINAGILRNAGNCRLDGVKLENSGRITNSGEFNLDTHVYEKRLYTVKLMPDAPETDEEWRSFWRWGEAWGYWAISDASGKAIGSAPAELYNSGTILTQGNWHMSNTVVRNDADLINEGNFEMYDNDAEHGDVKLPASAFTNNGTFVNGSLTGIGEEYNGSNAFCGLNHMALVNAGSITNNGNMNWRRVDYSQEQDAVFETYNAAGLELVAGSMQVPGGAAFKNEGYFKICDQYGAPGGMCDLSGFADFFTIWNQEGNDSHWCDFTAQVFDEAGYYAAAAEQATREETMRYNRMDFCDDITFTRDVTLDGFGDYWMQSKTEKAWQVWNEEFMQWDPAAEGTPGAEWIDRQVGTTLTVPRGVTLTIAKDQGLYVDGDGWGMRNFAPCRLVVEGTLVTEPGVEPTEENGWTYYNPGHVEIWAFGSFDASRGTVRNNGSFEVRDYDFGHLEEAEDGWNYIHDGILMRPENCTVSGEPANTVYAADVRSLTGLKKACADSRYRRILVRENCCITMDENLAIPDSVDYGVDIEPGSGLIVEAGKTLRIARAVSFHNNGDVSIYGNVIVDGELRNDQNLELGTVTGTQKAKLTVNGTLKNWNHMSIYDTGEVVLNDGGSIENAEGLLPVIAADGLQPGAYQRGVEFRQAVTLPGAPDGVWYEFANCVFHEEITLVYDGADAELNISFSEQSRLEQRVRVMAKNVGNESEINDRIRIYGEDDLAVTSQVPVQVGSRSFAELNGVKAESTSGEGDFALQLRREDRDGRVVSVFQVDANNNCNVKLHEALPEEYAELRLQQGGIDISDLKVSGHTRIHIGDEFQYSSVKIGSHQVELDDSSFPNSHGFEIIASEGAGITVYNSQMNYDGGYFATSVNVICADQSYQINPHIFGALVDSDPSIYIGMADKNAEFEVLADGSVLSFDKEYLSDGDQEKTHLSRHGDSAWFRASENEKPNVRLTVKLPGNISVVIDPVPVKPEWME